MRSKKFFLFSIYLFVLASCSNTNTTDKDALEVKDKKTVQVPVNPLKECYFGDLHLHTALSADANFFGATLFPEDSYKYAMGEEVIYMGQKVKRIAPLDFLAVTDHSEYLGAIIAVRDLFHV